MPVDIVGVGDLDDRSLIHDHDLVGNVFDDRKIVRDEDVRKVIFVLKVREQVQHLRLHRDIER